MMTPALYAKLAAQVARQQPELAAYDGDIADLSPTVALLTSSRDAARADLEAATQARAAAQAQASALHDQMAALAALLSAPPDGTTPEALAAAQADHAAATAALPAAIDAAQSAEAAEQAAQSAVTAAEQALAGPAATLQDLTARADAIRAAITQCQAEMAASGLALTEQDLAAQALQAARAAAVHAIDADTDAIYGAVVGNRATEYALAEAEADAFRDAGYTGTAPGGVAAWAAAKGWPAQQAADDILTTAAQWRTAQAAIRAQRLAAKEAVRTAADPAAVGAALAGWRGFAAQIRALLGL